MVCEFCVVVVNVGSLRVTIASHAGEVTMIIDEINGISRETRSTTSPVSMFQVVKFIGIVDFSLDDGVGAIRGRFP